MNNTGGNHLVNKKETITENLSSAQYVAVYDNFLYEAIAPIATKANTFIVQWAFDLIATIGSAPHKRAFSVQISPEEVSLLLGNLIVAPPEKRLHYIKQCRLDRAYLNALINNFLTIARKALPEDDPEKLSFQRNAERQIAMTTLGMRAWEVEPAVNIVDYYSNLARIFLTRIAEKYFRLAYIRMKAMMNNAMNISGEDLYMNNMHTIIRSIYKYSSEKGTLTNFLILWMRSNNNPRYGHEMGTAYSIPQGKRRELTNNNWEDKTGAVTNIAVNIDEALEVADDPDFASDDYDNILYKSVAMLRSYPTVRMYAVMSGFPDPVNSLTDHSNEDLREVEDDIAYQQDLSSLSGRTPQDLPFDW
jgi:hypothetical protein